MRYAATLLRYVTVTGYANEYCQPRWHDTLRTAPVAPGKMLPRYYFHRRCAPRAKMLTRQRRYAAAAVCSSSLLLPLL